MEIVWVTNFTQVRIHLLIEQKYLFGRAFTKSEKPHDCAVSLLFLEVNGLAFTVT